VASLLPLARFLAPIPEETPVHASHPFVTPTTSIADWFRAGLLAIARAISPTPMTFELGPLDFAIVANAPIRELADGGGAHAARVIAPGVRTGDLLVVEGVGRFRVATAVPINPRRGYPVGCANVVVYCLNLEPNGDH
jgi:hypothetical protein